MSLLFSFFPCLREKKLFFVKTKKKLFFVKTKKHQDLKERKASRFGEAADR